MVVKRRMVQMRAVVFDSVRYSRISKTSSSRRGISEQPQTTVEPPEYLNDAERQIFEKVKAGLAPTRLEVRIPMARSLDEEHNLT